MAKREDNPKKMNLYLSESCRTQLNDLARADRLAGDSSASPSSVVQKLVMAAHRKTPPSKFAPPARPVSNGRGRR